MHDLEAPKTYTKDEVVAASVQYFMREQGLPEEDALLPAKMWADKYALRKGEVFYELTPDDMHVRLAKEFHRIELKYPNPLPYETILEALRGFKYVVPQGSPQYGIGNDFQLTSLSNCAVVASPTDTMSGIIDTGREIANLYKRRFGAGLDLGLLRPDGSLVNNAAGTSTGAHSFMDFYSYITRMVGQSGRRGALMLTIPVNHPDVEKFITKKSDLSLVTGANVSVKVTDDFMRAVVADAPYTLEWTDGKRTFKREVRAKDIFRLIAEQATKTAEPGVLFWDRIQENLPLDFYREQGFEHISTNPCGELPLVAYDSCRLISLYLASFVENMFRLASKERREYDGTYFSFDKFEKMVRVAMRLSDDLVDLEIEKLEQIRAIADTADEREMFDKFIEKARLGRRTGLGTHGLGDALARLRTRYDSDRGIYAAGSIYRTLKLTAYKESVELAKERGAFPMWNPETEAECAFLHRIATEDPQLAEDMRKYGRRNGAILTNAPTGSVSIESENCSSGIEPVFMFSYQRNRKVDAGREDVTGLYRDAQGDYWRPYTVVHPNLQKFVRLAMQNPEAYGFVNNELRGLGYEAAFEYILANLPDFFVTAGEISAMKRVEMQGTIQAHIDHSISSTLNLPKGTTPEEVEAIYLEAWKRGCKGVTVYVDGSRDAQVLSAAPAKETKPEPVEEAVAEVAPSAVKNPNAVSHRGLETTGAMKKAAFRNADGRERKVYVYVGQNEDGHPVEVFVTDAGGDEDFLPYGAALGKLVSLALKHQVPVADVVKAIGGLKGGSTSFSGKIYTSVPDLVAKLLARAAYVPSAKAEDYVERRSGFPSTLTAGTAAVMPAFLFSSEQRCPQCSNFSVRRVDGCPTCSACGWAKC